MTATADTKVADRLRPLVEADPVVVLEIAGAISESGRLPPDAVTALSGSGPAYVFFFLEAMMQAAADMGLAPEQGRRLAQATFKGATALARASDESPETLRSRVTSKGGTTYAAITSMEHSDVKGQFIAAMRAAQQRASEEQANQLSVRLELQADCFAGVWAKHTDQSKHILEAGDVDAAMRAAASVPSHTITMPACCE